MVFPRRLARRVNNEAGISINAGTPATTAWLNGRPDGAGDFEIGGSQGQANSTGWPGRIDEVGFWKRVLTADERARFTTAARAWPTRSARRRRRPWLTTVTCWGRRECIKNVATKLVVFAHTPADGLPGVGDAANLTAYVSKDFGTVTALTDTSATELDATAARGYYLFDLTAAETNADTLLFTAKSTTAGVVCICVPAVVYTGVQLGNVAHGGAAATVTAERVVVAVHRRRTSRRMKLTGNGTGAGLACAAGATGPRVRSPPRRATGCRSRRRAGTASWRPANGTAKHGASSPGRWRRDRATD